MNRWWTLALLLACTPQPIAPSHDADSAAPPVPAPVDADTCGAACGAMLRVGCLQGRISDCASKLCQVNADPRFHHYDAGCIARAMTAAAVLACGMDCTLEGGR